MKNRTRIIVRWIGAAALLMACVSNAPVPQPPASLPGESTAARIAPEVRLRKLHLVRPDLIPYPVAYEVYC